MLARHTLRLPAPDAPGWRRIFARGTIDARTGSLVDFQNICDVRYAYDWGGPLLGSFGRDNFALL
eukprot:9902672-Alexandrium_andersonii.AAC.1